MAVPRPAMRPFVLFRDCWSRNMCRMVVCIWSIVEGRVAVHHHLHILVLVGKARDADVLELPVGYLFSHLLDPDAEKTLLVEVVVWVLPRLHRRVHELLHGCADDFIGDLVVVAAELLGGCLSVAADLAFILVLLDTEGCR